MHPVKRAARIVALVCQNKTQQIGVVGLLDAFVQEDHIARIVLCDAQFDPLLAQRLRHQMRTRHDRSWKGHHQNGALQHFGMLAVPVCCKRLLAQSTLSQPLAAAAAAAGAAHRLKQRQSTQKVN